MGIKFIPAPSMKLANEKLGQRYNGKWSSQMDRDWIADYNNSLLSVSSRLMNHPKFGKIEHVSIQIKVDQSDGIMFHDNSTYVNTELIQNVKDTLFGENRFAIQVYPKKEHLVDIMNIYHIFVFDKNVKDPFVIPNEDDLEIYDGYTTVVDGGEEMDSYLTEVLVYKPTITILDKKYETKLLKFQVANTDDHIWSRKYQVMQELYGAYVFGVEDYPFNKQYRKRKKTEHEPARIFVFDEKIDIPFGLDDNELDMTTPINRGAYMLNKPEIIAAQKLLEKFGM